MLRVLSTASALALAVVACGSDGEGEDVRGAGGDAGSNAGAAGNAGRSGSAGSRTSGGSAGSTAGNSAGAGKSGAPSASGATNAGSGDGGAPDSDTGASGAVSGTAGEAGGSASECSRDGDGKTTLVFVNHCSAGVTFRGSDIDGGMLAPGAVASDVDASDVEELSAKRYWGFAGEDPGAEHHTLAEFTFNTDFNDFDWYNISHVDAFNLPMQIVPMARNDCKTLTCAEDLLPGCPEAGKFENADGEVVACVSPDRNDGNSEVALYFEQCDDAYAWSGDDQNGDDPSPVRACAGEDWDIVFCPEGGA